MPEISNAISTYIRAKDNNRPWLMRQAFAEDACLEMAVNSTEISFPASAKGIDEITDVLVRRFSRENENVYTFCLSAPPDGYHAKYCCNWMVGMSRRDNGHVRVGFGRYDWSFSNTTEALADELKITIAAMDTIAPRYLPAVMNWFAGLPYPWCEASVAVKGMPGLAELQSISKFLQQDS